MSLPASAAQPPAQIEWVQSLELGYAIDDGPAPDTIQCFRCGSAHAQGKLLKCAKCKVASYCQKDCQVNDWKTGGHKLACDFYKRVGSTMVIRDEKDKEQARTDIFSRIRLYACPYAVHKSTTLGKGFLFLQGNNTLAAMSLPSPKDSYGRATTTPPRSLVLHYLTLGEYDSEVCRDDFELAMVRTKLQESVQNYDEEKQIVLLMRFRCGNLAVGVTPIVPDFSVCRKLGQDFYAESSAGALQLNIDDI